MCNTKTNSALHFIYIFHNIFLIIPVHVFLLFVSSALALRHNGRAYGIGKTLYIRPIGARNMMNTF